MEKKPLTPEQAAEYVSCEIHTVYRMIHTLRLPAMRLGRMYRIKPESLDALMVTAAK